MQKLKLKQKKEEKQEAKQKLSQKQRLALHALQKQLNILQLREWLIIIGFIGGAALLRVPMQAAPNVEPITFFALLAGWLFGKKKGFLTGASAGYISNFFVFGGQGPWTIFQVLGWGLAGFLGGFLRKNSKTFEVVIIAAIATLLFQLIVNTGWSFMLSKVFSISIFVSFLTALPFTLAQLISNSIFALFLPKVRKIIYEKGQFNEKELCIALISKLGGSPCFSWLNKFKKTAAEQ